MLPNDSNTLLRDQNLFIIFGVTLTTVMGVASIAPALPKMARVLDVSNEQIGLLITAFTLPGIFLTHVLGVMDEYWAAFLSLSWTVLRGGQALGPFLLGLIYTAGGLTATFLFTSGIAVLFLFVALLLIK